MSTACHIVALIPAYNEAESIAATIEAILSQDRVPDQVIVIPNGCTDMTADIARSYPVTVLELPPLRHKKSEALNQAWIRYARHADMVICLDADTVLPPDAVRAWEREFQRPQVRELPLGGSTSKFTMRGEGFLTRLQRAEFAQCINAALRRGYTTVLAGAGCAISGEALRRLATRDDREGPWTYGSLVEDFELTYRLRELGYVTVVSPTVRAYTDSMTSTRALHSQRMKWSTGTMRDLMRFGVNRLTIVQWAELALTSATSALRILWLVLMVALALIGEASFSWLWWVLVPALFIAVQVRYALRIPHRDRTDLLYAFLIVPAEVFAWLRIRWFLASCIEVLGDPARRLVRRAHKDRWALQYKAEAWGKTLWDKIQGAFARVVGSSFLAAIMVVVLGAAVPGLGVPNFGAALGLAEGAPLSDHQTHDPITVPVPAGYRPPADCKGYVALTYDDGPTEYSADLADTLQAFDLRATFFLLGTHVEQDPGIVRHLVDRGMWIGAHTMNHANLLGGQDLEESPEGSAIYGAGHVLTTAQKTAEIVSSAQRIEAVTGTYPKLFRAPYGYSSKTIRTIVESNGMHEAFWALDTEDWQGKSAEQIGQSLSSVKAGDVVLMHDDQDLDVLAVPHIAHALARSGLCTGQLVQGAKDLPFMNDQKLTSKTIVAKP